MGTLLHQAVVLLDSCAEEFVTSIVEALDGTVTLYAVGLQSQASHALVVDVSWAKLDRNDLAKRLEMDQGVLRAVGHASWANLSRADLAMRLSAEDGPSGAVVGRKASSRHGGRSSEPNDGDELETATTATSVATRGDFFAVGDEATSPGQAAFDRARIAADRSVRDLNDDYDDEEEDDDGVDDLVRDEPEGSLTRLSDAEVVAQIVESKTFRVRCITWNMVRASFGDDFRRDQTL
jgi:hypothetical protein